MYQVLYRKYRPRTFAEVVGQSAVTAALLGELRAGRPAHAYLFAGSRGTGKTTCAKIFAKAVNCLSPKDGEPCGECAICRGIDDGSVLDVVEIDAASNNGVDNIRDLRDEVHYMPALAKYRVYIIDEVHMLSPGAFNALLKTLEEPPAHAVFILATTEAHKLPATILSRCQRFTFGRIAPAAIAERLQTVAKNEAIELDDDAALLLARLADGAMRDALSLLDQCRSHGEHVTAAAVADTAGLAGDAHLFALADNIRSGDGAAALSLLDT
ncbi:MAG: DNA polymerase III subunit gamma/tau, partial [Oscillospiraceae bacterium]|nr:DNA polymerase III subunit gamma/tau [Oscillospiraceae bacterium]